MTGIAGRSLTLAQEEQEVAFSNSETICKQNSYHLSQHSKPDRITIREIDGAECPRSFDISRVMVQD
jgi:hypothetical protein